MALSCAFDNFASPESSMRRIQRFMAGFDFPMRLVSSFIFGLLPKKENLVLVMDRTNWKLGSKNISILMLGICCKKMAIPLIFKMLDKRGNSDTNERVDLVNKFIKLFGKDKIDRLLADREFIGHKWLGFLNDNQIKYYIKIRACLRSCKQQCQEGQIDELEACVELSFAIFPQSAALLQPGEAPLHDPPLGDYLEFVQFVAPGDLHLHAVTERVLHALLERLTAVSPIAQDGPHPAQAFLVAPQRH